LKKTIFAALNHKMVTLTKEEALEKIKSLVERFEEHKESYKKTEYNETQTSLQVRRYGWNSKLAT